MTNISAFKIHEDKNREPQNIVLVADSMESNPQSRRKDDLAQKLFVLNGALLMSSGVVNLGNQIYMNSS